MANTDYLDFNRIKEGHFNQFTQLKHQFDVVCEQLESGNYVAKRCGTFLKRFCALTEDYTTKVLALVAAERSPARYKKYGKDHMVPFRDLVRDMHSQIENENKKVQQVIAEIQKRVCEPLQAIIGEGDYQYRLLTVGFRKHKEVDDRLEETVEQKRRECLKLWDTLVIQHQKAKTAEKDLQSQDASQVKSAKLTKLQKKIVGLEQKENTIRYTVEKSFSKFENFLPKATLEKQELVEEFIPKIMNEMEALETARLLAMGNCIKKYQQLSQNKFIPIQKIHKTFQKITEDTVSDKMVKKCIRTWTDKHIHTYGIAPQFEPFPSLLPTSSYAVHFGKWNDEGTNFVYKKDKHDDQLKIMENGAGFLEILENSQLRRWKKRYFVIKDGTFQYFRESSNPKLLGIINLNRAMLKRFDAVEFDKDGCWTVTETIPLAKENQQHRDRSGVSDIDRGPFILSTPRARREHWINVLDRNIYNLQVEELKKSEEHEKGSNESNEEKRSSFDSQPVMYIISAHRRKPTTSPFGEISQNREFQKMKRLLIAETVNDGLDCIIEMILSEDMSEILALFDTISRPSYDKVAKALICVALVISEGKACQLLELAAKREVDRTVHQSVLFRIDSLASKMLTYYIRESAGPYIETMLSQCVKETILDLSKGGASFELDPVRVDDSLSTEERNLLIQWATHYDENSNSTDQKSESEIKQKIENAGQRVQLVIRALKNNKLHLENASKKILQRITSSVNYAPRYLRALLRYVQTIVNKKFPNTKWSAVAAILMLRFICPALSAGSMTKDRRRVKLSQTSQRNLLLVTKILQSLANGTEFGYKEKFMCLLKDFVKNETQSFTHFCKEFAAPPYPELNVNSITNSPNLCKKNIGEVRDYMFELKTMIELAKMENSKDWRVTIHYHVHDLIQKQQELKAVIKVNFKSQIGNLVEQAVQKGKNKKILEMHDEPSDFALSFPFKGIGLPNDKPLSNITTRDKAEFWLIDVNHHLKQTSPTITLSTCQVSPPASPIPSPGTTPSSSITPLILNLNDNEKKKRNTTEAKPISLHSSVIPSPKSQNKSHGS